MLQKCWILIFEKIKKFSLTFLIDFTYKFSLNSLGTIMYIWEKEMNLLHNIRNEVSFNFGIIKIFYSILFWYFNITSFLAISNHLCDYGEIIIRFVNNDTLVANTYVIISFNYLLDIFLKLIFFNSFVPLLNTLLRDLKGIFFLVLLL